MQWSVFGLGAQRRVMVLVISGSVINETLEHVTVLPVVELGGSREIYPNEALCVVQPETGGPLDVAVLAHQVRTLRKNDLGPRVGTVISQSDRRSILDALGVQLGASITGEQEEDDG